ncbi:MAG: ABC transporter six-transmembrane domain-containing protein [Pseudonocardia sp.]
MTALVRRLRQVAFPRARPRWPAAFRRNRWRVGLTYALVVLEQGFTIGYPWATGVAVDGLLDARPGALVPLVGIWLAHTVVGLVRQAYDTRLFTRVYAETVTEMLIAQDKATGGRRGLAQLAGRAGLARELVDFLEDDVPAALTAVLGCFGALALLIVYEPRAGGLAAVLLVPVAWLNWRYARRAAELNADLNDAAEREVDVVAARDRSRAEAHFSAVARLRVRLSDAEAHTWGVAELFVVGVAVGVLILLTHPAPATAGTIYAALAYLFRFVEGLDVAPHAIERTVQACDVSRRLGDAATARSD